MSQLDSVVSTFDSSTTISSHTMAFAVLTGSLTYEVQLLNTSVRFWNQQKTTQIDQDLLRVVEFCFNYSQTLFQRSLPMDRLDLIGVSRPFQTGIVAFSLDFFC